MRRETDVSRLLRNMPFERHAGRGVPGGCNVWIG